MSIETGAVRSQWPRDGAAARISHGLDVVHAVGFGEPGLNLQLKDLARAQAVEGASVPIKPGTALASGAYTLAPGGQTGWRALPGTAVLAVTKGTMTVRRADGCTTKDYALGQASVVPGGTYLIENTGKEPLELYGVFFDQAPGAPKPLVEGPTVASKCAGFAAASVCSPAGPPTYGCPISTATPASTSRA